MYKPIKPSIWWSFLLTLGLSACGAESFNKKIEKSKKHNTQTNTEQLKNDADFVGSIPKNAAFNVSTSHKIQLFFNHPIDRKTINNAVLVNEDLEKISLNFVFSNNDKTVTLVSSNSLTKNTVYTLLLNEVQNTVGRKINKVLSFTTEGLKSDRLALVEVYKALNGDNWPTVKKRNWNSAKSVCQWQGVTCNAKADAVSELYIGGSFRGHMHNSNFRHQIVGSLPPEIGHLRNLEKLTISHTYISGSIPKEIGHLKDLQSLVLSHNQFSGSLPKALSQLKKLQILNLKNNQLSGIISSSLDNLIQLQKLDLSNNKITGKIPTSLTFFSALQELDLSDNELNGPILYDIGNIHNLNYLDLSNNKIVGLIPVSFGKLKRLSYLNLANNRLIRSIPKEIGDLSSLKQLFLQHNRLQGYLPKEIGKLKQLRKINVRYNQLLLGVNDIPNAILDLKLKEFEYAYNWRKNQQQIKNTKLTIAPATPPPAIPLAANNQEDSKKPLKSTNLKTKESLLDLDIKAVENIFYQLSNGNKIYELTCHSRFLKCKDGRITELYITPYCGLTCVPDRTRYEKPYIPKSIAKLTGLKKLVINNTNIKGKIPSEIHNLSNLEHLDLRNNRFFGYIHGVEKLEKLTFLNLSRNRFVGTLPPNFYRLKSLITLDLRSNDFFDSLSYETFDNMKNLLHLDLSRNRFSGILPLSIFNLKKLRRLRLNNNDFTGFPSANIYHLEWLIELDLSENKFSGNIPEGLGSLKRLERLSLNNNKLEGGINNLIKNLVNIKYLNLSDNQLKGFLPKKIANLTKLMYLNLSKNGFYGSIPKEIYKTDMQYLYLNNNLFQGSLPKEISLLGGLLSELHVQNNQLTGDIPLEFNKLRNLSKFYFSGNKIKTTFRDQPLAHLQIYNHVKLDIPINWD